MICMSGKELRKTKRIEFRLINWMKKKKNDWNEEE